MALWYGLLPFKAAAELDVPYDKIIMALVDAERRPDWAPKLKAIAIHSQITTNRFEYSEYYKTLKYRKQYFNFRIRRSASQ